MGWLCVVVTVVVPAFVGVPAVRPRHDHGDGHEGGALVPGGEGSDTPRLSTHGAGRVAAGHPVIPPRDTNGAPPLAGREIGAPCHARTSHAPQSGLAGFAFYLGLPIRLVTRPFS